MKTLVLIFTISMLPLVALASRGGRSSLKRVPSVVSYQAWKAIKLAEAKSVVDSLKHSLRVAGHDGDEEECNHLQARLTQAQINLGVTRELSANDYFILYLMAHFRNNDDAFSYAARALNKKDVAEILKGYRQQFLTTEKAATPNTGVAAFTHDAF